MSDPSPISPNLIDNARARRFEMHLGEEIASLSYLRARGRLFLIHTEVPAALRGSGVGATLVRAVLERARADGSTVVPYCPFVRRFLDEHPEYSPIIELPDARPEDTGDSDAPMSPAAE